MSEVKNEISFEIAKQIHARSTALVDAILEIYRKQPPEEYDLFLLNHLSPVLLYSLSIQQTSNSFLIITHNNLKGETK